MPAIIAAHATVVTPLSKAPQKANILGVSLMKLIIQIVVMCPLHPAFLAEVVHSQHSITMLKQLLNKVPTNEP